MSQEVQLGFESLYTHAWNKDASALAVSPNTEEIHMFNMKDLGDDSKQFCLEGHTQHVNCMDWAPQTNQLLTCGSDRNAFVWNLNSATGKWDPTLVVLRVDRAAVYCKWSPSENRFAVGTGSKLICICHFDDINNLWACKHIKKQFKSTVNCLSWHPDGIVLAGGSTDCKVKTLTSHLKKIDSKLAPFNAWGITETSKMETDTGAEFETDQNGGWIHGIQFSPDGRKLLWVCHDSSVYIAEEGNVKKCIIYKTDLLPFLTCLWVSNVAFVCAGHDFCPFLFNFENGKVSSQ